jgi:hypothetical protein
VNTPDQLPDLWFRISPRPFLKKSTLITYVRIPENSRSVVGGGGGGEFHQ